MEIIFVCSGNTCRSPMCEGYLGGLLAKAGIKDVTVASAGTSTVDGLPASANSVRTLAKLGIDISSHASRAATRDMLAKADLIVAMTRSHLRSILSLDPAFAAKTRRLLDFSTIGPDDVGDPYGGGEEEYSFCFDSMREALDNIFLEILEKHKNNNLKK